MNSIECPRCGDPVRLPAIDVSADVSMRCAWCQETFAASELHDRLPPMLEVVSEDGSLVSPEELASVPEMSPVEVAGPEPESSLGEAEIDFGGDADYEPVAPMNVVSSPTLATRPRRKSSSPVKTLIGVILGGMLALPLAGAILSLSGNPLPIDLGFWPFLGSRQDGIPSGRRAALPSGASNLSGNSGAGDAGDNGSRLGSENPGQLAESGTSAAPLVISPPEEVYGSSDSVSPDEAISQITADQTTVPAEPLEAPMSQEFQTTPDNPEFNGDSLAVSDPVARSDETAEMSKEPVVEDSSVSTSLADLKVPEIEMGKKTADITPAFPETVQVAEDEDRRMMKPSGASLEVPPSVVEPPRALSDEIQSAVVQAKETFEDALATPGEGLEKQRALGAAYKKMADLGLQLEPATSGAPEVRELLATVKQSSAVLFFKKLSSAWITYTKRTNDGILLLGQSSSESGKPSITVESGNQVEIDSEDELPEGNVIAIGRILESEEGRVSRVQIAVVESLE